jgi:hypothetical protein
MALDDLTCSHFFPPRESRRAVAAQSYAQVGFPVAIYENIGKYWKIWENIGKYKKINLSLWEKYVKIPYIYNIHTVYTCFAFPFLG